MNRLCGPDHPNWGGDCITYKGAHLRVTRKRGRPSKCEKCGTTDPSKRYDWASIALPHSNPENYIRLCRSCHLLFDRAKKVLNLRCIECEQLFRWTLEPRMVRIGKTPRFCSKQCWHKTRVREMKRAA